MPNDDQSNNLAREVAAKRAAQAAAQKPATRTQEAAARAALVKAGVHYIGSAPAKGKLGPGIYVRTSGKPGTAPTKKTVTKVKSVAAAVALTKHKAAIKHVAVKAKKKATAPAKKTVKSSQVTTHSSGVVQVKKAAAPASSGSSGGGLGGGPAAGDSGSGFDIKGLLPLAGLAILILLFLYYLRHRKGRKKKIGGVL